MAQLIVRNLEDSVVQALKVRAARHRRSAEAEHREILRQALLGPQESPRSIKQILLSMPDVGDDGDFARPRDLGREVVL